jgi:hypothetical protein
MAVHFARAGRDTDDTKGPRCDISTMQKTGILPPQESGWSHDGPVRQLACRVCPGGCTDGGYGAGGAGTRGVVPRGHRPGHDQRHRQQFRVLQGLLGAFGGQGGFANPNAAGGGAGAGFDLFNNPPGSPGATGNAGGTAGNGQVGSNAFSGSNGGLGGVGLNSNVAATSGGTPALAVSPGTARGGLRRRWRYKRSRQGGFGGQGGLLGGTGQSGNPGNPGNPGGAGSGAGTRASAPH